MFNGFNDCDEKCSHSGVSESEINSFAFDSNDSYKSIPEKNESRLQWYLMRFDRVVTAELELLKNNVFVNKNAPDFLKIYKDNIPTTAATSTIKNNPQLFSVVKNFAKAEIINDLYYLGKEKPADSYETNLLDFKKESINNDTNPIEVLSYVGITTLKKNQ